MESMAIRGEYRLLLYLSICQTLKLYGTLKISYLIYIASIHKANTCFIWQKVKHSVGVLGLLLSIGISGYSNTQYSPLTFLLALLLPTESDMYGKIPVVDACAHAANAPPPPKKKKKKENTISCEGV